MKCACGRLKDKRSRRCSSCAGTSFGVGKKSSYLDADAVKKVVEESSTFLQAARALDVKRHTLTDFVRREGICVSHFRPARGRFSKPEDVLRKGSTASRYVVREMVRRLKLLDERCACGLKDAWLGVSLTLELDHRDGDRTNNDLSNLRFLCPNCHSQTPTHRGKNGRRYV